MTDPNNDSEDERLRTTGDLPSTIRPTETATAATRNAKTGLEQSTATDLLPLLAQLLQEMVIREASDLHLATGLPPYWRVHGRLQPDSAAATPNAAGAPVAVLRPRWHEPLAPVVLQELATALLAGRPISDLEQTGSLDGAIGLPQGTRFRFNLFRRQGQLAIALRRLEDEFRTLAELGLPDSLYTFCDCPDGLFLVAGPTGAGKSTTLATMLHRINQNRRCHIITIEDPIEYLHRPIQALVNQRQIGLDASHFNDALIAALRQDPDVILVGEIRELNTIRTAITAAETGHLVFSTVHAGDCVGTIERLVSVFPAEEQPGVRRQLALVLRAIVAQHLLLADGPAATRTTPDQVNGAKSHASARKGGRTKAYREQRRQRVVASEILVITPAVANLIVAAKSAQIYSAMETGTGYGMQTLEQDLAQLFVREWITENTATVYAKNPTILHDRIQGLRQARLRPN